jgi:hypothetical protein
LYGIERVDAAVAPAWHVVAQDRRDAVAQLQRLRFQALDQSGAQQQPLRHPRARARQPTDHRVGGQAIVERAVEHELDELLQIELMRGHAEHDLRRGGRRLPDRAGVAHGAIQPDVIDPLPMPARHTDRQVVPFLDDEAERRIAAGQLVPTDRRQRPEDPVGRQHAADRRSSEPPARCDRSVFEVVANVGVFDRRVALEREERPTSHQDEQRDYRGGGPPQEPALIRRHANAGGWNTDMICASISSRLLNRLSS